MSTEVRCISPDASVAEAAHLMRELDVGSLPVCDNDRLAGMITDRDIVVRAVADAADVKQFRVRDAMSEKIIFGFADQEIEEISEIMEDNQIRRLPLLNRDKRLVGIVATADLALETDPKSMGEVMREVSAPNKLKG